LNEKKIIGLGESLHGSKTVAQSQIQIAKYLIENQQCRLILFEMSMYDFLNYNLFIQGKFDDNKINDIINELSISLYDPTTLVNFLLWLREYNLKNENKVVVGGLLDINYDRLMNPLFDYLYAYYDEYTASTIYPVLKDVYDYHLLAALQKVNNSDRLKEIMGETEYTDLLYALNMILKALYDENLQINNDKSYQENQKLALNALFARDYSMWLVADRYISRLSESEKAVIIAHDGHINKKTTLFPYFYSMGSFLRDKYMENYAPIGIYVGGGSITSGNISDSIYTVIQLEHPVAGSIEEKCSKVHMPYFYYSSELLDKHNLYYRDIGWFYSPYHRIYNYGQIREKIDGFIFIDQSEASETQINDSEIYPRLMLDKLIKNRELMETLIKN